MPSEIQASKTENVAWKIRETNRNDGLKISENFTVILDDQTTTWSLSLAYSNVTGQNSLFLCNMDNSPPKFKIDCNFSVSRPGYRNLVESRSFRAKSKDFIKSRPEFLQELPKNVILFETPTNFAYEWNGKATVNFELTVHLLEPPEVKTSKIQSQNCLVPSFAEMFQNEKFSDFKIVSKDGESFKVHKFILAANSEVFKKMLTSEMKETQEGICEIEDFDSKIVEAMLKFMYFQEVSDLDKIARDLIYAAEKYEVKRLKNVCIKNIAQNMNIKNVIEALDISEEIPESEVLYKKCVAVVFDNYKELFKTPDWENMDKKLLLKVTNSIIVDFVDSETSKKKKLSPLTI